jgi:hypothetical protein
MNFQKIIGLLFAITIILIAAPTLFAQRYGTTVGARWGKSHFGASLQQRIEGNSTVEAMVLLNNGETTLSGLYEYHRPLLFKWKGFNTYVGAGAHYGWLNNDTLKDQFWGLDGIMGIEYKFPLLPIAASLDFKPTYNFSYYEKSSAFQPQFAVSIRYVLVTYREQEKRKKQREKERKKEQNKQQDQDERKGIFDIFDKKDDKKQQQDDPKKDDNKGILDIFNKKDKNDDKQDNKQSKPKDKEEDSFWDKINIFKKKDD